MKKAISLFSILLSFVLMAPVFSQTKVTKPGYTPPPTHTEVQITHTTNLYSPFIQVMVNGKRAGDVVANSTPLVLKLKNDATYTIVLNFRESGGRTWSKTKTIKIPWGHSTQIGIWSNDDGIWSSFDPPRGGRPVPTRGPQTRPR